MRKKEKAENSIPLREESLTLERERERL